MKTEMTMGEKVVKMRNKSGMSQATLAKNVFTSQAMINAIEHDATKPGIDLALRMADVFGCTLDELCR
mgnify:CR=1 FL=1